jgi:hypothetical protein
VSALTGPIRIFVDSNVLIEGLFAPWSAARAILILARVGVFRLVLSPYDGFFRRRRQLAQEFMPLQISRD